MPVLGFLEVVRKVHLSVLVVFSRDMRWEVEVLRSIVNNLRDSEELRGFTFAVGVDANVMSEDYKKQVELRERLRRLRRQATNEGVSQGMDAKDRELLFAVKVVRELQIQVEIVCV